MANPSAEERAKEIHLELGCACEAPKWCNCVNILADLIREAHRRGWDECRDLAGRKMWDLYNSGSNPVEIGNALVALEPESEKEPTNASDQQ